jgi:hypothetical protein
MDEIWKSVSGYEGYYEVRNTGRVRSLPREVPSANRWGPVKLRKRGKMLQPLTTRHGYHKVLLSKDGKTTNKLIGTLVAEAFLGPRPEGLLVLHSDGNAKNNCVDNLRYGTQQDNMRDSMRHGTRPHGRAHKCAKLTEHQVLEIRASGDTNVALAARFGVSPSTVRLARIGRNWTHL